MKLTKYLVPLLAILSLVLLVRGFSTPVTATEITYDYRSNPDYFDEATIPNGQLTVGQTGQIRPNQNSLFKDFRYAFRYEVSDPSVLSVDAEGHWQALKDGQVTLAVYARTVYNENADFEAELDQHGIKRILDNVGTTDIQYHVRHTITVSADDLTPVYRLYHSGLKNHLYTKDTNEAQVLQNRGWKLEGVAWSTRNTTGDAVYRLYHPGLKVHLYTKDANEYQVLGTRHWHQEGVAYRSNGNIPVYRLYHKGIQKHLYTRDENEKNVLSTRGWRYEGIAWMVEK